MGQAKRMLEEEADRSSAGQELAVEMEYASRCEIHDEVVDQLCFDPVDARERLSTPDECALLADYGFENVDEAVVAIEDGLKNMDDHCGSCAKNADS
jgi:hypothetical protein